MEKQSGTVLESVWDELKGPQKKEILEQVIEIERKLAFIKFTRYGGLYYKKDLSQPEDQTPLYTDENGSTVQSAKFTVGPTNDRTFFDFGKGTLNLDRGPCTLQPHL
jgi:hypothetical protein